MGNSRLCLLVMLGLLAMVSSFHAPPQGLTWAQWFNIQHVQMAHSKCDDAMLVVNGYRRRCKDLNTFLNTTFALVADVCNTANITCKNKKKNCHKSPGQVPLTNCNLTKNSSDYRQCNYQQTQLQKFYVIACELKGPEDSPEFPVVPVHLDKLI